ncbi:MAG TPA: DsbC family protein [Steroidobacteraceae bacterium]|nr:DsbC family protein [Steroidobacteraceae bacterium]
MVNRVVKLLAATAVIGAASLMWAPAGRARPADRAVARDPRIALLKLLPRGSKLGDLQPSPIPGIYQFMQGTEISYLTADGRYFIDGNIYDMHTRQNLTASRRARARVALIDSVPQSQMLIFAGRRPRYTITVFTDVDCAYCRELHSHIAELNALGVNVRYLFYPRTGPGTLSWRKAEAVWCSPDRKGAFTRAEAGQNPDLARICSPNPVAREYAIGRQIGVRGTPAIITASGAYIDGYLPPRQLVEDLQVLQRAQS